jgi:hypothetical protein
VNGENAEMWDFLLESFTHFGGCELFCLILLDDFMDLLDAGFTSLDWWGNLLDQGGFFWNLRKFVLDVLENLHWVIFSIEHLCHHLPWI